ncbi:MAG: hypothetical protein H6868_01510 [Rhodospirillales bacterium]|nr:hypothetical protein [Rhodospirillales bacterium]
MSDNSEKKLTHIIRSNRLLQAKVGNGPLDEKKIAKSQEVIDNFEIDFAPLATEHLDELEHLVVKALKAGSAPKELAEDITQTIMQLKANAGMFGYGLMGNLTTIMLNFLENIDEMDEDVVDIVDAHQQTLRAIVSNRMAGDGGEHGRELQKELKDACRRYFDKVSAAE